MTRMVALGLFCALVVSGLFAAPVLGATPVVVDHTATTVQDTPVVVDRTGDTYDATGAVPEVTAAPLHGSAAFDGDTLTYTPDSGYVGTDQFGYKVVDADDGDSNIATVTVTVDPVIIITVADADPVAVGDSATVAQDGSVDIDVLSNDSDPDAGDTVTIDQVVADPSHGTATPTAGKIRYRPTAGYHGSDSFTYRISDGNGGISAPATVSVTVTPNSDPVAGADTANVPEDGSVDVDVLGNDNDSDDTVLSITALSTPAHGTASVVSGKVRYIPVGNYSGQDTFTYKASDGHGGLSPATTVTVTVDSSNDPPTASADSASVAEDGSVDINVLGNDNDVDGDTLSITNLSDPTHGTASVSSGKVHYEPDANYDGSDSFTYAASDGSLSSNVVTVTITVQPVDDAPVAMDDEVTIPEDAPATAVLVLAGDTDVEHDPLTIGGKTNGMHGTVVITGGGSGLTYRPNPNYSGDDTFTYTISDGHLTDTGTVTVHVGGANDPPIAAPDEFHVAEGAHATVLLILDNDNDPDGNPLIVFSRTAALHGTVTITGNGTGLTYDPTGNYSGSDKFKYTITDGNGEYSTATVLITVDKDATPPTVSIPGDRFPGQTVSSSSTKLRVGWSGTDTGSGIAQYRFQMSTNGGAFKTVTLSSATSTSSQPSLKHGSTYRFQVHALDREGNWSPYVQTPTYTFVRYSESSAVYGGAWSKVSSSSLIGGSARSSSSSVKSASFTFTGYDVGWVATRTTSSGRARVFIDGVLVATVDLDVSSTRYRQLVFQRHFAVSGTHTLKIEPVGDGRVDIDAFVVLR